VQLIAWKDSPPNDLLCVEWDVKPYTLTHSLLLINIDVANVYDAQVNLSGLRRQEP